MAPYRGAGRPEATYTIERLIDIAARDIGLSPFELRRRNLVAPSAMPWQTGFTFRYDCGDFPGNMEIARELSAFDAFEARRAEAAARGSCEALASPTPSKWPAALLATAVPTPPM
ncbi:molybdopterin cofactor-binding domain-containing protein [Marinivivus vitaminiproducens]|uniref:molybdopterin cofactor-binding domain-containing protein n=1 Tax=Marinivivus vitaminiproducens TaxID=3035935 RepID=UPI003F9EC62E